MDIHLPGSESGELTCEALRAGSLIPFVGPPARDLWPGNLESGAPAGSRCQPIVSCFIATFPRSGSWFLAEGLANTGLAGIPNEYFRPDFTSLWSAEWGLADGIPYRSYVEAAKRLTVSANGVFSAKLHWYQFAWLCRQLRAQDGQREAESAAKTMARWFPDPRYVFLWRRDTARQAVSYYRASVTQAWFLAGETARQPLDPDIDLQQIKWFEEVLLEHRTSWRAYFAEHGITPLEVIYEDLASDYRRAVSEVLRYLGVAANMAVPLPRPTLRRQSDDQSEAILERYLAVRDALAPRPDGLSWSAEEKRFRLLLRPELAMLRGQSRTRSSKAAFEYRGEKVIPGDVDQV